MANWWIEGLKEYNRNNVKWQIPKKGTPEYDLVKKLGMLKISQKGGSIIDKEGIARMKDAEYRKKYYEKIEEEERLGLRPKMPTVMTAENPDFLINRLIKKGGNYKDPYKIKEELPENLKDTKASRYIPVLKMFGLGKKQNGGGLKDMAINLAKGVVKKNLEHAIQQATTDLPQLIRKI